MMLPYPNKIQDFWVFGACSLLQKLIPTALNMEPPTVAAFVGHVSCAKKNSDMFQLAAIPAPDSENVWLPTFHDLADRIIRVVTLLKKTRLKTHDFFASKMPCIGRNGEWSMEPKRKRRNNSFRTWTCWHEAMGGYAAVLHTLPVRWPQLPNRVI